MYGFNLKERQSSDFLITLTNSIGIDDRIRENN